MVNQEYHKGSFCIYTSIFCQEGYCAECDIYRKRQAVFKNTDRIGGVKLQKAHQSVLVH